MPSILEQALARTRAALLAGGTPAADRVERGRQSAIAADATPAINIRRGDADFDPHASGIDHATLRMDIEFWTAGADWETAADALHMQCHALLLADSQLAGLLTGLRCGGITPRDGPGGAAPTGVLTAHYEGQALVRRADHSRYLSS